MFIPISWLKQYVPVKLPLPKLVERLSEVGIGVEAVHKKEEETILELEITPNRPDLLSIIGVAREVAAIQKNTVTFKTKPPAGWRVKKKLPLAVKNNFALCERFTAIIIDNITVKASPLWLAERLTSISQRSINNIVDLTNFVMFELGNPIHAFDYDKIEGHTMTVAQAVGGESFVSVDNISYKLPKDAMIIKDAKRIIDLCGIKGGANSGITKTTKRLLLLFPVFDGKRIRKTSLALGLRSEASSIFERGVNKGGTLEALARTVALVQQLAGGKVASDVLDLKKSAFTPWHVTLSLKRLEKMLGVAVDEKKVLTILSNLNLSAQKTGDIIKTTVPAYRNDLQIEEDLIEEVARMYGYNKFPKTLPKGTIPTSGIPYEANTKEEKYMKDLMTALGLSEVNSYSLVSNADIPLVEIKKENLIELANPVSREYDIMRPTLLVNLLKAIPQNLKHHDHIALFELGKIYRRDGNQVLETRSLAGCLYPSDFFAMKGLIETFFSHLDITVRFEPKNGEKPFAKARTVRIFAGKESLGTLGEMGKSVLQELRLDQTGTCFTIDVENLLEILPKEKVYKPIPKYPSLVEDISLVVPKTVLTGDIVEEMKKASLLLVRVEFLDSFGDTKTFRLTFQHPEKNLSNPEVSLIRTHILNHLKTKFQAELKS